MAQQGFFGNAALDEQEAPQVVGAVGNELFYADAVLHVFVKPDEGFAGPACRTQAEQFVQAVNADKAELVPDLGVAYFVSREGRNLVKEGVGVAHGTA